MGENSKFCNFWAISTCYTSKESIFHIEFNFLLKDMICLKKNWKKSNFHFSLWKSMLTCCLQLQIPHICAKRFENWVHLCFEKVFKLQVIKRKLITSSHLKIVDGYIKWWLFQPPTVWLKVWMSDKYTSTVMLQFWVRQSQAMYI